jgi:hypothetical protein
VRAREEQLAGGFGGAVARRGETEKGEEGADEWGQRVREREKRGHAWAEERGNGPGAAHAGKGKEGGCAGPRERKERGKGSPREKGEWAGLGGGLGCLALLLLLSFSFTQSIQTNYLNLNRFEFKPYKLNTRKIMLQHECTSKLILW